jgi:asparagine synthase (glutamine-hydrolysing)
MCGIFGWITPGREVDRSRAEEATNRMRHRGPDDEGYLLVRLGTGERALGGGRETNPALDLKDLRDTQLIPGADLVFGFRRLSIHDLSEHGHQPMGTSDGKLWIVFNGEVYNFPELRVELEAEGARFRSGTDTEVILRAYEAWGDRCWHRFNGMWAITILDLRGPEPADRLLA